MPKRIQKKLIELADGFIESVTDDELEAMEEEALKYDGIEGWRVLSDEEVNELVFWE